MELTQLIVLFFVVVFSLRTGAVTFSTVTYPGPDFDNTTVIILPEEANATVTFQCVAYQDGDLRDTVWYIQRDGVSVTNPQLDLESVLNKPQFVRSGPQNQNLTIINVTSDLDRAQVWCGPSVDQVEPRFLLGFEVAAQLVATGMIAVREGDNFSVSLEAQNNRPFSPLVTFQWTFNGTMLNSTQRILLDGYNITIMGVQREDAGGYQLVVNNSAGSGEGNFSLNVQFGPNAMDVSESPSYFVRGTDITLVAFTDIEGNPEPTSTWTLNSTAISTSDSRFNTMVPGQLSITNISAADAGTYNCTLSNGDLTFDRSAIIELGLGVFPTMPENVTAEEVNATSATLMWDAPSQGTFNISFYRVRLVPSPSNEVIQTIMTEEFVSGLIPGIEYNVTVAAVFTDPLSQQEFEVESLSVLFTTSVTAPLFEQVDIINEVGYISVNWRLLYTGGLDTTVESVCNIDDGASGSGYDSMSSLSGAPANIPSNSEYLMGSMSLGPVQAGATYICVVTAYNSNGSDEAVRPDLTSDIGIPSAPAIMDTMVFPGMVVLTVETTSPGGTGVSFNVTISDNDSAEIEIVQFIIANYNPNEGAVLTLSVPNGGSFLITVVSFNSFGSLGVEDSVNVDDVPRAPSTSTPGIVTSTTSPPPTGTSTGEPATTGTAMVPPAGGLSGGEVAGIVIAMLIIAALIFLIILVVVYLYIRNRGESYQVDKPQSKNAVKMTEVEVDIGTELDSRPPEEPEKLKANEVQYADLDHFRKKEQTPDDTTPLAPSPAANPALEPVTYSVIQPQPVKPEENGSQPQAADGSDATSI